MIPTFERIYYMKFLKKQQPQHLRHHQQQYGKESIHIHGIRTYLYNSMNNLRTVSRDTGELCILLKQVVYIHLKRRYYSFNKINGFMSISKITFRRKKIYTQYMSTYFQYYKTYNESQCNIYKHKQQSRREKVEFECFHDITGSVDPQIEAARGRISKTDNAIEFNMIAL